MIIDIICLLLVIVAFIKGMSKGLVLAVFSFLGIIIGLAAALKLSTVVAVWLQGNTHIGARWLPVVSFAIVLVAVILLVRWCAALIQAGMDMVMLGWLNKLAGACLYTALYLAVFSVLLFFAEQTRLLKKETIQQSVCYKWVEPWGQVVVNSLGKLIPLFKDMFTQLENFFGAMAGKT